MPPERLSTKAFRSGLADWFETVARDLPWRRSSDPYRTWVSEIMLQQTRVDQALPYFQRFTRAFPDVGALADASLDEVLLAWEGLGYYSRARNLHAAARMVVREHDGSLPSDYAGLKALPGVGDYTAAAVGSMAFGVPEAVLDGNVIRVLARYDAVEGDVSRSAVRRSLRERAQELLDADAPGVHNEAMMELGATVCSPQRPACDRCPVRGGCMAFASGTVERYPVKRKKAPVPEYEVAVGILRRRDDHVFIQRRPEEAMLGGLWEFPGGKCQKDEDPEAACLRELREELGIEAIIVRHLATIRHAYSHFRIRLHAMECRLVSGTPRARSGEPSLWVAPSSLGDYAFPRANRRLIEMLAEGAPLD